MATASEIISNQGNPDLGFGSNPSIPMGGGGDLETLTRIGDQIMYQNMAQNKYLFDQKVKDRDKLLSNISSGDIKVGDLLEDDTPYVKEGLDDLDVAWEEMIKKGKNDLGAQSTYKKALREAQDRVTQAQGRKVFYDSETGALAKETLPRKQSARKENLDKTIKGGFWKDLMPYQQTMDFDFNPIKGFVKKNTTEITDPNDPLKKIKKTTVDIPATFQETKRDFLEGKEGRENQFELLKKYQGLQPDDRIKQIEAMNNRLRPLGLEVKVGEMPDGSLAINESVPDFAAKWAIALDPQLQTSSSEYDKDALDLKRLNETERHNRAMEGLDRSKLALQWKNYDLDYKKAGITDQMAESAKKYAEALIGKLNGMKNADGVIPISELSKLTNDERKYMGVGSTTENKFSLSPLDMKGVTGMVLEDDGTIKVFSGGNSKALGKQRGGSINITTIATNKLGDEMTQTSGKEGYNFNNLIPLYKGGEAKPDQSNYYNDEKNVQSQKGNRITYKDGSVWEISGNEMKKIK